MFKSTANSGRNFACPNCGASPAAKPDRRAQVITCEACDTRASLAEWTQWPAGTQLAGRAGHPPAGTRIRRENAAGGTVWHIPARGKFGFFMFFAMLWCSITAVLSGGFLLAFLTGGKIEGDGPTWLLIPFFGLFWAVGFGMLYAGLREKWLKQRIAVAGGELVLRREMFGRSSEKRLPLGEICSIEQKEFYQKNYQPVFGIEIKSTRSKLRFGSTLEAAEKGWLTADLREAVFGSAPVRDEPAAPFGQRTDFSVEIPNARKQSLAFAIVLLALGTVFLVVVTMFFEGPGGGEAWADRLFDLADLGFRGIFSLVGVAALIGGAVMLARLLLNRGSVQMLEGNAVEIALRTYRGGRVWKERTFPRGQIGDIRASTSGSSGNRPMKRLELIAGEEVVRLASWIDAEAADAVVAELRPCL